MEEANLSLRPSKVEGHNESLQENKIISLRLEKSKGTGKEFCRRKSAIEHSSLPTFKQRERDALSQSAKKVKGGQRNQRLSLKLNRDGGPLQSPRA